MLLPSLLLDEIFSFLDTDDIHTLLPVCHEFYHLALPRLLHVHTLKGNKEARYSDFIKKNGRFVKGLVIKEFRDFIEFQSSGLTLASIFPNLRSVSLERVCAAWGVGLTEFCNQCIKLKYLKHLGLDKWEEDKPFAGLSAVVSKLDSLYVNFYPHKILENQQEYKGLKRLMMPVEFYYFYGTLKDFTFPELWLINANIPMICSKPSSNGSRGWLEYTGVGAKGYFKMPFGLQSSGLKILTENPMVYPIFPDTFYLTGSYDAYVDISATPDFVEHCTLIFSTTKRERNDVLSPIRDIPSLDMICKFKMDSLWFKEQTFQATKLSLLVHNQNFPETFAWAVRCFPHLQHLYVANTFSEEMLPLVNNAFPNLTHFYSRVKQSDWFWTELVRTAPKLLYVHTNSIESDITAFESLKPFLRLKPYKNILEIPNNFYGKSGFNHCLKL
ncbi:hypothetical protein DSO57_1004601 [Entomophthora muscae]|uniref:Uncharacterized protein n=1 Tax=Entomophthora muscae TaxID=34485 RepID=A0ACC2TVD5_9FUNG|nr:hypothetical protein DSO57_1004601 [Entomophthora muscae]